MEAAVLWKAAMRPRLPTGLGKRRQEAAAVSHSSHSPCYWKKRAQGKGRGGANPAPPHINKQSTGGVFCLPTRGEIWGPLTNGRVFELHHVPGPLAYRSQVVTSVSVAPSPPHSPGS